MRNKPDNYVGLSIMGKIRLRTWYQTALTEADYMDASATIVTRALPRPDPTPLDTAEPTTPVDPTTEETVVQVETEE